MTHNFLKSGFCLVEKGVTLLNREKRRRERKRRFFLAIFVALAVLAVILHRQIIQGVFSPLIKGAYYHVETDEQAVAFTFDVVWEPGFVAEILDVLDRYNTRATFFLTGTWMRKNSTLAREILMRGHEIGHHGYSHQRLTELTDEAVEKEFAQMEEALREELNLTTDLFRPPYGELDNRIADFAAGRGYRTVLWSINPHDWLDPGKDKIISRVIKNLHSGAIITFHTSSTQTIEALPLIIQSLRMKEYEILKFSELMERGRK